MDKLIMSRTEREQLTVFEKLKMKEITQIAAAQMLSISDRWIRKKLRRYMMQGAKGLIHKARGRPSPRQWDAGEKAMALDLLKSDWTGFGPTFAVQKLSELYGVHVSAETLRKAMIFAGLWKPGRRRARHRMWRERKHIFGVLIQLDGSPHDWFEERGPKCTLLVFIDDATSKILWLEFVESESFEGVACATKRYMEKFGRPVSFYVDFGSVFSVNTNNPERDKKTEFERIMKELSVDVSHARSPQAKGRVERANQTLQDRLVKEMRLAGISSILDANRFVWQSGFIEEHNRRFAVPPATAGNAHRSIDGFDLYSVFCSQEERVVANDHTVKYKCACLQLLSEQPTIIRPKNRVIICEYLDGQISIKVRNCLLNFKEVNMQKTRRLSPVEYVMKENLAALYNGLATPPPDGSLPVVLAGQDSLVVNRNFSCC